MPRVTRKFCPLARKPCATVTVLAVGKGLKCPNNGWCQAKVLQRAATAAQWEADGAKSSP